MGLQRIVRWAVPLAGVVLLASGCSGAVGTRLAMPDPASEQGEHILSLWQGAWIAALATGAVVWGLIFFVVIRYRRRSDNEIPVQTRYNLPLEIFYTIAPVIMVVVFFSNTVRTHLRHIYAKLDAHTRSEAVTRARRLGLLAPAGLSAR